MTRDRNYWRTLGDNSNGILSLSKCEEFGELMVNYWLFNSDPLALIYVRLWQMIDRSTETNKMKRVYDDMLMPPVQTNEISRRSINTVP